jgi:hypothetical protein
MRRSCSPKSIGSVDGVAEVLAVAEGERHR